MPHKAKDHSDMQKCVCLMCWRKPKPGVLKNITPSIRQLLKMLVLPEIECSRWSWLPRVICLGCATELRKAMSDPSYVLKHMSMMI